MEALAEGSSSPLSNGLLYHSPRGLYPFQAELVGYAYVRRNNLARVDTGLGKTHIAMALAALLLQDGLIDLVVVLAEGNKIREWRDDLSVFTDIPAVLFYGDPERRAKLTVRLANGDLDGHALVTTYHTFREDILTKGSVKPPSPLREALALRRTLLVCDEMTLVAGRTSKLHKAVNHVAHTLDTRVLGLTATPITTSIESMYNLGRILCPELVGTVQQFEHDHVARFDNFNRPWKFKNEELLAAKMAPVMLNKRKTDPDVIDQFPKTIEDFISIELDPKHQELYDRLHDFFEERADANGVPPKSSFMTLQRFANHPRSILLSDSKLVAEFLTDVPAKTIESLVCSKSEAVIRKVQAIVAQGDQVIVFCDSIQVLQALEADLRQAKMNPSRFHGGVSNDQREREKQAFKDGTNRVILMSKAGERGINLPEAAYIINYDVPLLHSSYIQRTNRGSRIGEGGEFLSVITYMAIDTVEEGSVRTWMSRNRQSDKTLDRDVPEDDAFVTAAARQAMIRASRTRMEPSSAA